MVPEVYTALYKHGKKRSLLRGIFIVIEKVVEEVIKAGRGQAALQTSVRAARQKERL